MVTISEFSKQLFKKIEIKITLTFSIVTTYTCQKIYDQKKVKINLQFKMVSYICYRIQEEKFELIATSS